MGRMGNNTDTYGPLVVREVRYVKVISRLIENNQAKSWNCKKVLPTAW